MVRNSVEIVRNSAERFEIVPKSCSKVIFKVFDLSEMVWDDSEAWIVFSRKMMQNGGGISSFGLNGPKL